MLGSHGAGGGSTGAKFSPFAEATNTSGPPPLMGRKGHPFSPPVSWRTPAPSAPGRASEEQGHYQEGGGQFSFESSGKGCTHTHIESEKHVYTPSYTHTHVDKLTVCPGPPCICTHQSSNPPATPLNIPAVHAEQPGEALLPADGGLGGSQAGRWEGVAGGRQGPWRAQAPPGWVQGQGSGPPPTLSVTAPHAP